MAAAPQDPGSALSGVGGTWNADGDIVFAPSLTTSLMRVAAAGGAPVVVTTLAPQQQGHAVPHFLPDGRRFLFYVRGAPDTAGIYLGALDGSAPTRVTAADSAGVYLPSGWLLWVRAGTLVAQRLDVAQVALTGEPVTLGGRRGGGWPLLSERRLGGGDGAGGLPDGIGQSAATDMD